MKLLFVDGTANHNPKQRKSSPTGGILNSLTLIPEYLASKGHEVYVQSTYQPENGWEVINGVTYVKVDSTVPKWDVTIFNRNVLPRDFVFYCKEQDIKVVWWLHDIVQTTYFKDDTYKYVDHVIALSDYCKKTYSDFYSLDENKISIIPNGVDKELFHPGKYEDRDSNLYIMASALIKGILPIPTLFDNLKRVNPEIDFRIYSSQSLHSLPNTATQNEFLMAMEKAGAHVYSPVSQEVLAHLLRKAHCLLMPNSYPEICSNLLLQARASGCPIVTSNIGANAEFINNKVNGLMTTQYNPHDMYSWVIEYTNLVFNLSNKDLHKTISNNAPIGVLDWNQVGRLWEDELLKVVNRELQVL